MWVGRREWEGGLKGKYTCWPVDDTHTTLDQTFLITLSQYPQTYTSFACLIVYVTPQQLLHKTFLKPLLLL